MADGVAIVTGATGAIGKAIAWGIASRGYEVVLPCRDERRAERAVREVRKRSGSDAVRWELVDLSRKASIDAFAGRWQGPLHVLVNNAAVTPRQREETPERIEMQWATNVLGYVWMMEAFADILAANRPARIVNVASYWTGGLDLSDPEFRQRPYNNDDAYRASKQADRMLSTAFAEHFAGRGIAVNACHPGDVNSALSNNLGFGGHESPDQGAETPVWLATSPDCEGVTGRYFEHLRETVCRYSQDKEAGAALYARCASG